MGRILLMINFEITYESTFCEEWPKIQVIHNDTVVKDVECDKDKFTFVLAPYKSNIIKLDWYNKNETHTKIENGVTIEDQTFKIKNIRVDDIQIETWFWTEGYYEPRYFKGFIQQHNDTRQNYPLEKTMKSQLIWHFPGCFTLPKFVDDFWDWYFKEKQNKEVIKFLDKDPDRIHKFRGSLDPCKDLVTKIKQLI